MNWCSKDSDGFVFHSTSSIPELLSTSEDKNTMNKSCQVWMLTSFGVFQISVFKKFQWIKFRHHYCPKLKYSPRIFAFYVKACYILRPVHTMRFIVVHDSIQTHWFVNHLFGVSIIQWNLSIADILYSRHLPGDTFFRNGLVSYKILIRETSV